MSKGLNIQWMNRVLEVLVVVLVVVLESNVKAAWRSRGIKSSSRCPRSVSRLINLARMA
jgi:hypothetical protein